MRRIHPIALEFQNFIEDTIDYRIGVIGQVDAGKSALVNELAGTAAHISTQTDATRTIIRHEYGRRGWLLDFPGVGTAEYSPKQYKKLLRRTNIKHVLYVFSSKIREADEEMIRFLAKKKISVTFVYNKADTLTDVSGEKDSGTLMHDKDTELHVTFKRDLDQPLRYIFISIKDDYGLGALRAALNPIFDDKDSTFNKRAGSAKYLEKFLNKKLNRLGTKLLSPGFKDVILKKAYRSIEEMTESHYSVTEQDEAAAGMEIPRAADYINRAKESDKDGKKSKEYIGRLATVFSTVFKLRKLNVVSFVFSTLGEMGIRNIFPVLKGTFDYAGEMNDFAREVLKSHREEIIRKQES